ncbi:LPS-assembly protein LptD [Marinicella gelatinilytica]|uniref:LPS-assembly protein LptD n=1 Tax=Marinicella gelatinilytica TaxID=2996017 RepID=UPI0022609FCF|nr:LPS assembly protein LptD [Marinicella gelatinilytica]MCX7545699.1 LPS assembly protein LptD [Marinicella gelatinilytica]
MPNKNLIFFVLLILLIPSFGHAQINDCPVIDMALNPEHQACFEQPIFDEKVRLAARETKRLDDNRLLIHGDVCIKQNDVSLLTPSLIYDRSDLTFHSQGIVQLQNKSQRISAMSVIMDTEHEETQLREVNYFLIDSDMNGQADYMKIADNQSHLQTVTFSTCAPAQRDWEVRAESADLDHTEGVGTFRNLTLRIKNVPVLYLPYAKLPINDDRRSGFLVPGVSYSNTTGLDLSVPYYINIKPNMDMTLTPRFIADHGVMLGAQYRYLTAQSQGVFEGSFLPNDDKRLRDRSLVDYRHTTRISDGWRFDSHIQSVSDSRYYEDFASSAYITSTPYLKSKIGIRGSAPSWQFFAGINEYDVLSEQITPAREPYRTLPEVSFDWFQNNYAQQYSYGVQSELINFYKEDAIGAWRTDITPWIEKQWTSAWGYIKPKLQYRSTHYNFDDNRPDINRNLPIISADLGLTFQKNDNDGGYKTIEPRLFYTYAPYRDQSDIPIFDSRELSFGSSLLFQTNRFSGADRQSDMNQAALAFTQRNFGDDGQERWNWTIGQINYFEDQQVQINDNPQTITQSPIIFDYNLFLSQYWSAGLSLHYNEDDTELERGALRIQHITDNNTLYNFAYRYRRSKIEQFDASVVLPINNRHRIIARWNYSTRSSKTIEALFGYEHKSCCWAFRLVARHYLVDESGLSNNGIYAEIQLNGLGSLGRDPRQLLQQSILGYQETF